MTKKLQQSIKEVIAKLPKEVQGAIMAIDWTSLTEEIGKKHFLTDEEISKIQAETFIIISGIDVPDNYAWNIERELALSTKEIEKISEEVNQKILKPMYEILSRNIKTKIKNNDAHWKQTLDFILSGGDYTVFLEEGYNSSTKNGVSETETLDNSSRINNIKNRFVI